MQGLVVELKSRPLLDQFAHFRIVLMKLFVEPGELREHLQVAEILGAEQAPRALGVRSGRCQAS